MDSEHLQNKLAEFAERREWLRFHTPKNLVMALSGEVGELTEIFQWLSSEESQDIMQDAKKAEKVKEEIADILLYLLRLADILSIDLMQASLDKLQINERKYPVELSRGVSKKYTEFSSHE